tara:strand:- start:1258 stop:1389 length:132 start_codon:yes stop_codon:yes gene_type:complete
MRVKVTMKRGLKGGLAGLNEAGVLFNPFKMIGQECVASLLSGP